LTIMSTLPTQTQILVTKMIWNMSPAKSKFASYICPFCIALHLNMFSIFCFLDL
jgi:hypothetical protein